MNRELEKFLVYQMKQKGQLECGNTHTHTQLPDSYMQQNSAQKM